MMAGWNGGFNVPPLHQQPYSSLQIHQNYLGPPTLPQTLAPNLISYPPNRHQFHPHHTPPFQCQQAPTYGHHPSTSQFMMTPAPQFQGSPETFHQGYVTAGGPFSAHQNAEGPFYRHHPTNEHRQVLNYMGPPTHIHFNPRQPIHPQQGFEPNYFNKPADLLSTFGDVCGQYGIALPPYQKGYLGKVVNDDSIKNMYFSVKDDNNNLNEGIFEPLQPPQIHEPFTTDATRPSFATYNPTRRTTPSDCVLERNTAANFDDSSEELAEIFGKKSSASSVTSRASSKTSSKQESSSGYIFHSDDENYEVPSMDAAMGSTKAFNDTPINQGGCMEVCQERSSNENNTHVECNHIKPPPGFTHIKPDCPPQDQLHKVGYIIKGMLKIDGKRVPSTSPHEGNTIRSMIHQPIYSNCESRLMKQECEAKQNEKQTDNTPVLNSANTGQKRYIQRITTHFRILFEPIPDMFEDN